MKNNIDHGWFNYNYNGHLVLFKRCILCDFWIPLKRTIKCKENGLKQ
jgi:hypothetical protein